MMRRVPPFISRGWHLLALALRMSKPDMDELRQGNRGAETRRSRRLREALVAVQMAFAVALMTQVGLIGRTTWQLHYLDKAVLFACLVASRTFDGAGDSQQ
jgi:hypothetical protein